MIFQFGERFMASEMQTAINYVQEKDLSFVERFKIEKGKQYFDEFFYFAVVKDSQLDENQALSYLDFKDHLSKRIEAIKEIVKVLTYKLGELSDNAVI